MSETKYKVNEIFYSIQAEGGNAGSAAVFVRFSGCNLRCPFCDTDHEPFSEMTGEEIGEEVLRLDPSGTAMVVFTGGEPTLQLRDDEELCAGRFRAMESNGILPAPRWVDWVTVSPKTKFDRRFLRADELKFVMGTFDEKELERVEEAVAQMAAMWHTPQVALYIQPMADKDGRFDVAPAVDFVLRHPRWNLSLQWHKVFGVR